ncbi:54S ribosomal protein L23, mitochondrial [Yamadazyma tenuis]|uniref:54S ribosomal protein L23, mitochondrial n=1 Tax=Candida tenuis TaxID=2315449 RepID=UPI0027A6AD83|nr:54S ribosomal protein L23, mitochondrial [Yamadazyma tenuis]
MSQRIGNAAVALTRVWHHVDVAGDHRTLGRLASSIAIALQGKHKPTFSPNRDHGDYVVVTNCAHLKITGSLNLIPMQRMIDNKGYNEVLRRAVKGMIPKNKLRLVRMDRLKLYDGDEHPYKQNLIAFADEAQEVREKIANLEQSEKEKQELREKFFSQ